MAYLEGKINKIHYYLQRCTFIFMDYLRKRIKHYKISKIIIVFHKKYIEFSKIKRDRQAYTTKRY